MPGSASYHRLPHPRRRTPTTSPSTALSRNLASPFWATIEQINPNQPDLALSSEVYDQWRAELQYQQRDRTKLRKGAASHPAGRPRPLPRPAMLGHRRTRAVGTVGGSLPDQAERSQGFLQTPAGDQPADGRQDPSASRCCLCWSSTSRRARTSDRPARSRRPVGLGRALRAPGPAATAAPTPRRIDRRRAKPPRPSLRSGSTTRTPARPFNVTWPRTRPSGSGRPSRSCGTAAFASRSSAN